MLSMEKILDRSGKEFQTDYEFTYGNNPYYLLNQQKVASWLGAAIIAIPLVMLVSVPLLGNCFYWSISHFYYTQFVGAFFVASLAYIGTFFIAYRGGNIHEKEITSVAGVLAIAVALIPTEEAGCKQDAFSGRAFVDLQRDNPGQLHDVVAATDASAYFQLFPNAGTLHLFVAAVLFLLLAYYSRRVFTRYDSDQKRQSEEGAANKALRNKIYVWAARIVTASIAILFGFFVLAEFSGLDLEWWNANRLTFVFESFVLVPVGLSWLVKGRFWSRYLLDDRDLQALAIKKEASQLE